MKRLAICAVLTSAFSACSSGTPVAFHNTSEHRLESVVISGSGFEASLGAIAPGQSITVDVYPSGESGLDVSFAAKGQDYSYGPQDYFEGGGSYKVSATVNQDLTVAVSSEISL
ncbi:hypothetical protein [Pseudoxanthomonas dokdonensis]|uniref:hypothetical protein n=1 Tax=Pseudoxanthomonas dokdonensis TaxID=344882 RepID=UPI00070DCA92|nr:hypothetical protein [Pseudoxanthomonas dokdonensis]